MIRADLLKIFRPQGGLSTWSKATFVTRACAYFKVDVEFSSNSAARDTDVILAISRPYVDDRMILD